MFNGRVIQFFSLLLAMLTVIGAGVVVGPLGEWRGEDRLGRVDIDTSAVPPHVMLAVAAAGPFRALAVDYLWYRAQKRQEQGQYFEANQLSQWITSLQPRSGFVWAFHAWNMAFNISVETYTPEERWGWVSNGIALLRDKGIKYNPRGVRLYRELGWIYFFKIGKFTDDMHWYYKRRLARDWEQLLGAPTVGATTPQVIDAFRAVAEADRSVLTDTAGPGPVADLLSKLVALGYSPDENLLRQLGRVLMFERSMAGRLVGTAWLAEKGEVDPRVVAIVKGVENRRVELGPLLAALRRVVLEDSCRMDPGFMLELMQRYGPLDWRHAASHALYWSDMGVRMSGADPGNMDLLNTNRQAIHSLQLLTRYGLISFDPLTGQIDLLPDPRFIVAYDLAYDLAMQRMTRGEYSEAAGKTFEKGHENFLLDAVTLHYLYGEIDEARRFYRKVRQIYGSTPDNLRTGRYRRPMVQLIAEELRTHGDMMGTASQFIRGMLRAAFERGLGEGRMTVFEKFVQLARYQHRKYQEDRLNKATTDQGRMRLLSFDDIVSETYLSYMQAPSVPIMSRVRVWANTPGDLKARVASRLLPTLEAHATQFGLDPRRAFPPPAGDRWRIGSDSEDLGSDEQAVPSTIERR